MPSVLVNASTTVQTVLYLALLWKLVRSGLAPIYKAFTALVLFEPLRSLTALLIERNSETYAWFYFLTQPVQWMLYALVTLEVYNSVFRTLTGISKLSRYVIIAATGLAVAASTLSLLLHSASSRFPVLELYLSLERSIFLSLLAFVLMLVIFLSWYPVPVHRNAVVYSAVFALYFGVKIGALLVRTVGGPAFATASSIAVIAASAISCLLWTILLTQVGETRSAKPVHRLTPEREAQLRAQLESMNSALLGSVPERG